MKLVLRKGFIFWVLGIIVMVFLSIKIGPSTDEIHQQPYGNLSYKFYKSFGQNDSATHKTDDLITYYGALIDTIPELLKEVTPFDLFTLRHIVIALFSFLYLLYGYKIAEMFGGYKYGLITLLILIFLPRIIGEAFNNPKDTPFAAGYLMGIYYILRYFSSFPNNRRTDLIWLTISIGLCINIRVGGLLLFFYLLMFILIWLLMNRSIWIEYKKNDLLRNKKLIELILVIIGGYSIGVLFWPSALVSPIAFPLEALGIFSKFPVSIKTLFEGNWIMSTELPNYYLLKYIIISNPEVIFAGLLLGIFTINRFNKNEKIFLFFLLFTSVFPLVYVIYKKSAFYNGWRQIYFVFAPLAVVAGIFWSQMIFNSQSKQVRYIAILAFIALIMLPASFILRNYPIHYIYFNHLSGGIDKNYGRFEMDYYGHSVNEATFWIQKNHPEWFLDSNIKVASNVSYNMTKILDRWNYKKPIAYVRFRERFDSDWDIGIFSPAFVDPAIMQNNLFKSKSVIHSIDIDGKPIGIIIKRQDKNDFYGKKAIDSQQYPKAIEYLTKAVQYDPNNEIAWTNLGLAQLQTNQIQLAINSLNNAIKISPENIMAQNYLGYAYLNSGNIGYAQSVFLHILEENPNMPDPYRMLAQIYQQQGNTQLAQQYMGIYQQITGQMGR